MWVLSIVLLGALALLIARVLYWCERKVSEIQEMYCREALELEEERVKSFGTQYTKEQCKNGLKKTQKRSSGSLIESLDLTNMHKTKTASASLNATTQTSQPKKGKRISTTSLDKSTIFSPTYVDVMEMVHTQKTSGKTTTGIDK